MTTSETMAEVTNRGQEAFASAMKIWADTWRPFVNLWPALNVNVSGADDVVDKAYDLAAQALITQREFTKTMLAVTRSAASNAAWVAQDNTKAAAGAKRTSS